MDRRSSRDRDRHRHRRSRDTETRYSTHEEGEIRSGSHRDRHHRHNRPEKRARFAESVKDTGGNSSSESDHEYKRRVAAALEEHIDPEDEDRLIAERKARLARIRAAAESRASSVSSDVSTAPQPTPVVEKAVEQSVESDEEEETREVVADGHAFEPGQIKRSVSTMDIFAEEWEEEQMDDETLDGINPHLDGVDRGADQTLADNWDDVEGYYMTRVNETLNGRFLVTNTIGRGVFSSVLRCNDIASPGREVAVKIIRSNETMYKFAQKEAQILGLITDSDPENKRHCVRLYETFDYRNHFCIVFELMDMNLRTVLSKFGKEVGLSMKAVRVYGRQMLIALRLLDKLHIIHADLKPDNLVVNSSKNVVKLCDFGSAMLESDQREDEVTPYLVSRFYRPPEVILGAHPYKTAVDMWSVGATLYELFTGKICFKGKTNNDMLKLFMDLHGPLPRKMVQKARFAQDHFDLKTGAFLQSIIDPVTMEPRIRQITVQKPIRDLASDLRAPLLKSGIQLDQTESTQLKHFRDLLERIFVIDPGKRISPDDALRHSFFKDH